MTARKPLPPEASCYAVEAIWQFVPDVKCRDDGNVLLSPLQCETLLRRFGWRPVSESRPTPNGWPAPIGMTDEQIDSIAMRNARDQVRAEVLRELAEWEAEYQQQARGGDNSGRSDAKADAAREIADHLRASWDKIFDKIEGAS